ncbi:BBE domain-containing protein [Streptomyces wedmorensis]|uniref:BBE domain-containing protein n=1 Tax=Streptomyces wedmorensis TaxID=43759 RepID=A0ABW6IUJ3_STRWE
MRGSLDTDAAYVNFLDPDPDPDPDPDNGQHPYYGANYARLTEIKRRYDSTGLFCHP